MIIRPGSAHSTRSAAPPEPVAVDHSLFRSAESLLKRLAQSVHQVHSVQHTLAATQAAQPKPRNPRLAQNLFDHPRRFDAGQFHIQSLEGDRETVVVNAQKMEHGRVQIAYMNRILDGVVAELVRCFRS